MLSCQIVTELNNYIKLEYSSASAYSARSIWFAEQNKIDLALIFRELAQSSVTKMTKVYTFLDAQQASPSIEHNISAMDFCIEAIINEITSDYNLRSDCIGNLEKIVMPGSGFSTILLMSKVRNIHNDEHVILLSALELLQKLALDS